MAKKLEAMQSKIRMVGALRRPGGPRESRRLQDPESRILMAVSSQGEQKGGGLKEVVQETAEEIERKRRELEERWALARRT